ncbi:MAG: acetyl-CoA carboxylase biotin carboxyl carrier protein [Candidatus Rokubacteria bacterium]|nr:acetyl-CoA carboxylase biotin carboxyl carrier protein [Candidatus Rokubacteria bacterium]
MVGKRREGGKGGEGQALPSIRELVELASEHDLAELDVARGDTRVRIVREHPGGGAAVRMAPAVDSLASQPERAIEAETDLVRLEAPMVGTFYRAPSPEAAPFVNEGDRVKQGQVVCIIEAMKLMNEIEAKLAGRIAKILVDNAQPVEYGQPLLLIDPRV